MGFRENEDLSQARSIDIADKALEQCQLIEKEDIFNLRIHRGGGRSYFAGALGESKRLSEIPEYSHALQQWSACGSRLGDGNVRNLQGI